MVLQLSKEDDVIERKWKTLGGQPIDLREAIAAELRTAEVPVEIHIGTDSQQAGKDTEYVTVVVVERKTKGSRVFFTREKVPRVKSLRERLYKEVWHTTELGMELTTTPDIGDVDAVQKALITLHIDANPDPRYKSSEYVRELASLAMGQGFRYLLKPDSWAAAHAADHAVKHKDQRNMPKRARRRAA